MLKSWLAVWLSVKSLVSTCTFFYKCSYEYYEYWGKISICIPFNCICWFVKRVIYEHKMWGDFNAKFSIRNFLINVELKFLGSLFFQFYYFSFTFLETIDPDKKMGVRVLIRHVSAVDVTHILSNRYSRVHRSTTLKNTSEQLSFFGACSSHSSTSSLMST